MTNTLILQGIPTDSNGGGRGGIMMPKQKFKFRVRVIGFGPVGGGIELSQQVQSCGRPNRAQNSVTVHSYNSVAYIAGKGEWQTLEITVRDDVTNSVSALVGYQLQKQMNLFEQTTPLAGVDYKFQTYIETLDGSNDDPIETWFLEGCFLESVNYDSFDYSSSEPVTIQMTLRFDNATQSGGLMPDPVVALNGTTTG